jgi:thiamine pyrophosphate-dependent acetolactate synthase large subunit-like protein
MYGTPGPVYIDLPADIIYGKIEEKLINYYPIVDPLPALQLPESLISSTLTLLK